MGKLGCSLNGSLDDSKFSEPMPWIGTYVAAASAACAFAMAMDCIHGIRNKKFWFPTKFFSLNATTLTLAATAIKFSVDLNTPMPRRRDQLAKLSSAVFICTVMGNFMPSLGTMNNEEMIMNIMALGILVITVIVNIGIQLVTGVIYAYRKEHVVIMCIMLILLIILCSSALTVPTTKCYFDLKYKKKQKLALKECEGTCDAAVTDKLKDNLTKNWVMAHTSNPQLVLGRLATSTASGALCLFGASILGQAMIRSYFMATPFKFCEGESDYKWSSPLVLVTQTIAVGVGTIGPVFRWFAPVNFRCPKKAIKACLPEIKVEKYWIHKLVQWKESPLGLRICGQRCRRIAHSTKNQILDWIILVQIGIVGMSKLMRMVSIFFMSVFLTCQHRFKSLIKCKNYMDSEVKNGTNLDLSRFVLHLEGEEDMVNLMMENSCDTTGYWFKMGEEKQPEDLIRLVEKSSSRTPFEGVNNFDSYQISSLDSEEPPNCWALPVVTLASICIALPNVNKKSIKWLIGSVNEGLSYVRVVEKNLDSKRVLTNVRKAAEIVWLGVDLYRRWLNVDLCNVTPQAKSPKEILEALADTAKNKFMEFRGNDITACLRDTPFKWPHEVLAANSMYRVCKTLLLDYERKNYENGEILLQNSYTMISDILGACFTNLPRVISMECNRSTIEEREECVHQAIFLLGKTEKILKILDRKPLPSTDPDLLACIDKWRGLNKGKDPLHLTSSSGDSETASEHGSLDLYLNID